MNQGNKVQKIVIAAFCIVALLYFIGYAVRTFRSDVTTTVIHAATVEDSVSGTGLVAREEQVIQAAGELVQVLPGEGETVARGETIARVYKSEEALHKQELLDQKESELSSLQYVLSHSSESSDTVELGRRIVSSIQDIRVRVAREDLTRLDEEMQDALLEVQRGTGNGGGSGKTVKALVIALIAVTLAALGVLSWALLGGGGRPLPPWPGRAPRRGEEPLRSPGGSHRGAVRRLLPAPQRGTARELPEGQCAPPVYPGGGHFRHSARGRHHAVGRSPCGLYPAGRGGGAGGYGLFPRLCRRGHPQSGGGSAQPQLRLPLRYRGLLGGRDGVHLYRDRERG